MSVSGDETRIGVIVGRIVVQDELEITHIVVYQKRGKEYVLQRVRKFEFADACITFSFSNQSKEDLLFFTKGEVFKFNYMNERKKRETIY